jgi:hypothetical protein
MINRSKPKAYSQKIMRKGHFWILHLEQTEGLEIRKVGFSLSLDLSSLIPSVMP